MRLWELTERVPATQPKPADLVEGSQGPEELFKAGMGRFDEGKPAEAAPYFHTVATDFPAASNALRRPSDNVRLPAPSTPSIAISTARA